MKTKYLLLSFVFAAFLSSSMPLGSHSLEIGKEAPSLTLSSSSRLKDLSSTEGKYVVINFWNPADPISRINNRRLAEAVSACDPSKVEFVSICTGDNPTLANEIMKTDSIADKAISLSSSDLSPQVEEDYQSTTGLRSFVIDPFGNLVSILPAPESINSIIA